MRSGKGTRRPRPAVVGVLVVVVLGWAGCSGGDGGEVGDDALSTTSSTRSFEEADTALSVNIAATGMNIVATEVGLRTAQGQGPDYCRATATSELQPHQATLESADDGQVRERAGAALAVLRQAIEQCTGGDGDAVRASLNSYNEKFRTLQQRIDVLIGN